MTPLYCSSLARFPPSRPKKRTSLVSFSLKRSSRSWTRRWGTSRAVSARRARPRRDTRSASGRRRRRFFWRQPGRPRGRRRCQCGPSPSCRARPADRGRRGGRLLLPEQGHCTVWKKIIDDNLLTTAFNIALDRTSLAWVEVAWWSAKLS